MLFTVFTPTYNRAKLLERAYHSLKKQECSEFEWLIVDDGSTDDTEMLVAEWIAKEKEFPIRYFKKENEGKHVAINLGVTKANGIFFTILDSDDQFTRTALKSYKENLHLIEKTEFGGIIGLNQNNAGEMTGTKFTRNKMYVDFPMLYYKLNVKGDKSVLWKTEYLNLFPFPIKENVKFVSESVVWHPLSMKYPVLCINEFIGIIEYQTSGLSDSSYKKEFLKGIAFTNFYLLKNNIHSWKKYPKIRWQEYVQLIINSKLTNISYFSQLKPLDKIGYILAYPRSYYSYLNMRKYVEKNQE